MNVMSILFSENLENELLKESPILVTSPAPE